MRWRRSSAGLVCVSVLFAVAAAALPPAPGSLTLDDLSQRGRSLYAAGLFQQAERVFRQGSEESLRLRDNKRAIRFFINVGGAQTGQMRYKDALASFLQAEKLALALNDTEALGVIASNAASLYSQFGDTGAAAQALERAERFLSAGSPYRPMLLVNRGLLAMQQDDSAAGRRLLREAIASAWKAWDKSSLAYAWNTLGLVLLCDGELPAAEDALAESYRLRRLHKLDSLDSSLYNLGRLRMAQRRPADAVRLLESALEVHRARPGNLANWKLLLECGRARQAAGDARGALAAFRNAHREAGQWRTEALGGDWSRVLVDARSTEIGEALASLAASPAASRQLGVEAFLAIESSRADRLRAHALRSAALAARLPAGYGETLSRLRTAQIAAYASASAGEPDETRRLRAQLAAMESEAGLGLPATEDPISARTSLGRLSRFLNNDEALLSFHVGDRHTVLWTLTRAGLEQRLLPGRSVLVGWIASFRKSLLAGDPNTPGDAGAHLAAAIFSGLGRAAHTRERWLLSLDDALFQLPFAALPLKGGFLVERHSLEVVPSAFWLGGRGGLPPLSGYLGFGDPVYNAADPRYRPESSAFTPPALLREVLHPPRAFASTVAVLPRLVAGGQEVRDAAAEWTRQGFHAVTLMGNSATRSALESEIARGVPVVHLAAHVVASQAASGESAVLWSATPAGTGFRTYRRPGEFFQALGLTPSGQPDFLSTADIAAYHLNSPVVILSGCHSGAGNALPGAGVLGLCRAWMAAGARGVVATHWPVVDERGSLLTVFHRQLAARTHVGSARSFDALRLAQLAMLRSGSWCAQPRYWAAYFDLGKE